MMVENEKVNMITPLDVIKRQNDMMLVGFKSMTEHLKVDYDLSTNLASIGNQRRNLIYGYGKVFDVMVFAFGVIAAVIYVKNKQRSAKTQEFISGMKEDITI